MFIQFCQAGKLPQLLVISREALLSNSSSAYYGLKVTTFSFRCPPLLFGKFEITLTLSAATELIPSLSWKEVN